MEVAKMKDAAVVDKKFTPYRRAHMNISPFEIIHRTLTRTEALGLTTLLSEEKQSIPFGLLLSPSAQELKLEGKHLHSIKGAIDQIMAFVAKDGGTWATSNMRVSPISASRHPRHATTLSAACEMMRPPLKTSREWRYLDS